MAGIEQIWAVDAPGALAHETRLTVFRKLVQAGLEDILAGEIAQACGVLSSTMSHQPANLERAGLAVSQRESRAIRYRAQYDGRRRLMGFLMEDCCQDDTAAVRRSVPAIGPRPAAGPYLAAAHQYHYGTFHFPTATYLVHSFRDSEGKPAWHSSKR